MRVSPVPMVCAAGSRRRRRLTYVALVAAVVLAIADAPAARATAAVGLFGSQLVYGEALGQDDEDLTITFDGTAYQFSDPGTTILPVTAECVDPGGLGHLITCTPGAIEGLQVAVGNGDDRVTVEGPTPSFLCGGDGNDHLVGGPVDDTLVGGPGVDDLSGRAGVDDLIAEATSDCVDQPGQGGATTNTLDGGDGVDFLYGGPGDDTMLGGSDHDFVFGFGGADQISGGGGADELVGLDGPDRLSGGEGDDVLSGGAGDDRLLGDAGNDELGAIVLIELEGNEFASVDDGDDDMDGGTGDDALAGGPVVPGGTRVFGYRTQPPPAVLQTASPNGADTLHGGPGRDQVTYEMRLGPLDVTLDGVRNDGAPGEGDLVDVDVEALTGGPGPNRLVGSAADNRLDGAGGPDVLVGGDGMDRLDGGALGEAADDLDGGLGPDELDGGPGDDRLAGAAGSDRLIGGGGNDVLDGGSGDDLVNGGAGDDTLRDSAGANTLDGEAGADLADYGASERPVSAVLDARRNDGAEGRDQLIHIESLRGGAAADVLRGDASANTIDGGAGNDVIDGGPGVDVVRAGPGRDAVRSRDDGRDEVACGPGADFAAVEALDTLARTPRERCERADNGETRRPKARRFAVLRPRACEVAVSFPRTDWFVPVQDDIRLPFGSRVRADGCAASIATVGVDRRRIAVATLSAGAVMVRQPRSRRLLTEMRLFGGDFRRCNPSARRSHLSIRQGRVQLRGAFRIRGRYSEARTTGAALLVEDRCDGTLTRVISGTARVLDLPGGGQVTVRRGGRHLARRSGS
jgi:Ca2+-binding RTX toxin-like protein